jgi:hypothetical protein
MGKKRDARKAAEAASRAAHPAGKKLQTNPAPQARPVKLVIHLVDEAGNQLQYEWPLNEGMSVDYEASTDGVMFGSLAAEYAPQEGDKAVVMRKDTWTITSQRAQTVDAWSARAMVGPNRWPL